MMSTNPASSSANDNRRIAERHSLMGAQVRLLADGISFVVHLKDLSATGLCGLTDAPLAPGQMICLLLDQREPVAAEIKWIRKALIGAAFTEPLSPELLMRLKKDHAKQRREHPCD